jgi:D-glycero-D-manno-heptose 1,7-bisphosphate phosphatase
MKLLGLTGGIGMGKSACADLLRQRGIPVVDTDELARELVEPGQPALREILDAFGPEMADAEGCLRREALARLVFADGDARKKLEAVLHPRIRAAWIERVEGFRKAGAPLAVVVIPLLFETGAESDFDAVICLACSPATQQARLQSRGWSAEEICGRINSQLPVAEKMARSDFIIWSEGDLSAHAAQVDRIIARTASAVPAVFLDRDGTMIEEREYLADPAGVKVFPGVGSALRRLQDAGFRLVMVTNQSGIGRGYYSESDMHRVNARLDELLAADGVRIDRVYFAPEAPDQPSRGRKPSPQFLFDARDELGIDLARSYMIGDKLIDLECGWNAGVRRSILVRTGYGSSVEAAAPNKLAAAWVADDLSAASALILDCNSVSPCLRGEPSDSMR